MENSFWIDLGLIGHKAKPLTNLFRNEFMSDVPIDNSLIDLREVSIDKFVVFIDYTLGGTGETGTRVFTNAFANELQFFKKLSDKLINEYVKVNQSLDFKQDF